MSERLPARVRALLASDFLRHGAIVFAATMTINVLGYAFHFATSRKLGVVGYGELSALNAAFMISLVVPQIGSTIAIKYAAGFHTAGDGAGLSALTRGFVRTAWIGSAIALVVLLALTIPIAAFLGIADRMAVALAMVMISFSMAAGVLRGLFQGADDFTGYAISLVIESLLKFVLGVGLVYAGFGVLGAFEGWACASFVALVYTIAVLLRSIGRKRGHPLDLHVATLLRTMTGVTLATVLIAVISNADLLVVKHFADPMTAGLYGALSLAGKILLFLVAFVPLVVLPKATRTALEGKPATGILLQALGVSAAMSLPGLIFYYFEPRLIVTSLAGSAFAAATPYVFAYGVAMVELAVVSVVVYYKMGIHRFDFIGPLGLCALAEVIGISIYHQSLARVIDILIGGNFVAAVSVSWRVWVSARIEEPVAREQLPALEAI